VVPVYCAPFPGSAGARQHTVNILSFMALFLEFAAQQWVLIAALFVVIALLVAHEARRAGPALSPQQAINLVNREGGVFVDLRDAAAFKKSHIVDATHIPMSKLAERRGELEPNRDKPVILVCNMGQQASSASKQLKAQGFSEVYKMAGGMMEWSNLQLPTVTK
jgi:rhodanese-related sulfurtransferase